MRRNGIKWWLAAAAMLVVATAWGLSVSVGAGAGVVRLSSLPDGGFDATVGRAQQVLRGEWGPALGQFGVAYDGEATGPNAFGIDDRGRVYVLDQVNQRIVRYTGSVAETSFALPDVCFDDLAVSRDRIAALSRNEDRRALVFGSDGSLVATLPACAALPAISRVAIVDGEVCVQCPTAEAMNLHTLGRLADGAPAKESEQLRAVDVMPMPSGLSFKAGKVDEHDIVVSILDAGGKEQRRLLVHSDRAISAIVDVLPDLHDNLYVVYGLYEEDTTDPSVAKGRLVIAKYSADGDLLGRIETGDDYTPEPQRKFAVSEAGDLYQLTTDETGVSVLRWTLETGEVGG